MTDRQTVRIYCGGQPTTATSYERAPDTFRCDRCGNLVRHIVVWGERAHLPKIRKLRR